MPWLKISFVVPGSVVEAVSLELQQEGVLATSLFDAGQQDFLETGPESMASWSQVRVETITSLEVSLQRLDHLMSQYGANDFSVSFLQDKTWELEWRNQSKRMQFGRLQIVPRDQTGRVDGPVVKLDPGLAFGTGEHATTAMCLSWLQKMDLEGKSVLDFGCGSGILGIAASKMGAGYVEAIDIDERAIEATLQNAAFNGADLRVEQYVSRTRTFDVVVGNVLLNTLVEYANELTNATASLGVIGLTGLLIGQQKSIAEAFTSMCFEPPVYRDEWVLMIGQKRCHDT